MSNESIEDALIPAIHHPIKLATFEGPMDLLLYLIRKSEIDIYDIPIEKVTHQYLDFLYSSESMDLELTGDFFVMAATLMVIKSRMLLPKHEQEVEEEVEAEEADPRWELVQQLLQYKKIKDEAQELEALIAKNHDVLPRIADLNSLPSLLRPLKDSSNIDIWNAFNKVLTKLAEKLVVGEIQEEHHTVADRMTFILQTLKAESQFNFSQLFTSQTSIGILVNTFLAILELTRLKVLYLEQVDNFEDIKCTRREMPVEGHTDFAHLIVDSEPSQ